MTHQIGHHHMPDCDRIEALYIIWAESPEYLRPDWDALHT